MSAVSDFEEIKKDVARVQAEFSEIPQDPRDVSWVQAKLLHMFEVDEYVRNFMVNVFYTSTEPKTDHEKRAFCDFLSAIDQQNTRDLKDILKIHGWVNVSTFGKDADYHAFVLVQHADHDRAFQKEVLQKLETLYPANETRPQNYAYLYDRVSEGMQRYGTQGKHDAQGQWEPLPCEDIKHLDERRKEMGLEPLAQYRQRCSVVIAQKAVMKP